MQASIRIVHPNSPQFLLDPTGILYLADGGVVILTLGGKLKFTLGQPADAWIVKRWQQTERRD